MPDNDLGRAHGEIEIKSNVDVARAIAALQALKGRVDSLGDRMSRASREADRFQRNMDKISRKMRPAANSAKVLAGGLGAVGLQAGKATSKIVQLDSTLDQLKKTAVSTYSAFGEMQSTFGSIGGFLGSAGKAVSGLNKELANFPQWTQDVVKLTGAIGGTSAAFRTLGRRTGALTSLRLVATRLSSIGAAAATAGILVGRADNVFANFFRRMYNNSETAKRFAGHMRGATEEMGVFGRTVRNIVPDGDRFLKGMTKMIFGVAAMKKGFTGLMNMSKMFIAAFGALSVVSGSMSALSTTILGLANAIGQLSGAALLLPGAYMTMITAVGVAIPAFKGLGAALKAAWEDSEKFEEELKNVPEPMRDIARQVHALKPQIENLNKVIQTHFWAGLGDNIKDIGNNYMPILEDGVAKVSNAFARARQNLVSFFLEGQTKKDFAGIFQNTALTIGNLSDGLKPFLEGLRDIGMVGSQYLSQLTGGAQMLAIRFKVWASTARESGQAMEWIHRAVTGIRDLRIIIDQTGRGLGKFFQMFSRSDPSNALSKAADKMREFNKYMMAAQRGDPGNTLASTVERVQQMASVSKRIWDALIEQIRNVMDATKGMGKEFYDAFGNRLVQTIQIVGKFVEVLSKVINAVPGLSSLVGTIVAMAAAAKGLQFASKPFMRIGEFLGGSWSFAKGAQETILSVGQAFEKVQNSGSRFVSQGGRIQAGFGRMANGALGLASVMSGPVVAGIMIAVAALSMFYSSIQQGREEQKAVEDGYRKSTEAIIEYGEALRAANGEVTTEGMDKLTNAAKEFSATLEKSAKNDGKWYNVASDMFGDVFKGMFGAENEDISRKKDEVAGAAQTMQKAFKDLGVSEKDLSRYLAGDDATWLNFIARLKQSGAVSGESMTKLQGLRTEAQAQANAAKEVGTDNLAVANGIKALADEATSATDRLNALKSVMTAMGLIQSTAAEAAANWTLRTKELADSVTQQFSGIDFSALKGASELTVESLQKMSEQGNIGAATLTKSLAGISAEFLATAEKTGNAEQAYKQLDGTFAALAASTGLPEERIRALAQSFGVLPDQVSILLAVKGLDAAQADIFSAMTQIQNIPENKDVKITIGTSQAYDALKKAGVIIKNWDPKTKTVKINIPPGTGPQVIEKIKAELKAAGVPEAKIKALLDDPSVQKARKEMAKPVNVPVKPGQKPPEPGQPAPKQEEQKPPSAPKQEEQKPPPAPETKKPPPAPETKTEGGDKKETFEVEVKGTDAAIGAVNAVRTALEAAKAVGTTSLNLEIRGTDAAIGAVNSVIVAINNLKSQVGTTTANVELRGTDAAIGAANAVVDAVNNMANQIIAAVQRAGSAVDQFVGRVRSISTTFNSVAAQATASGASLGQNFANGIASKESAVREAALKLARAASDPLPRSPAKIGPFSGRGWTPFRGQSLALGFAQGISKGAPVVQGETLDMVMSISNALEAMGKTFRLNLAPTHLGSNRKPGASGAMFYRDPEITDEELREKRRERNEKARESQELQDYKETLKLPDLRERKGKAEETVRKRQEALDKAKASGDAERIRKSEESLRKAQESVGKYSERILRAENKGAGLDGGYSQASGNLTSFVQSLDDAQYGMGQFNRSMIDCSGFVSAVANEATGREAFSERASTVNMREFLLARGFKEGMGGAGDLRVGWWDNGGGPNGHTALTLPDGTRAESTTGGVRYGPGAAGHDSAQMTNHMYLPGSAAKSLGDISRNTGEMSDDTKKELAEARKNNKSLDNALNTLANPRASDIEVIRALQDTSDARVKASPLLKQELDKRMDSVMEDRGIKKYDPREGAYKTDQEKVQGGIKAVQSLLSLHDIIVNGVANAQQTMGLLARGLENTDSVNQLIDGVQSMAESVTSIIDTIAQIAEIAVKAAGTAAAAIPYIGPVIAAVAQIVDVAGIVQTVVDTAQQAYKIGMRYIGKALSWIMGGASGPLTGKVRTLLDTNDQTIKRWSEDNPHDKRSSSYDPFNVIPDKQVSGSGINNLNVYANPDAPADEIINEAMYAVRSSGTGAYND